MMREATIKRIIEIMHRNGDPDRDPGRWDSVKKWILDEIMQKKDLDNMKTRNLRKELEKFSLNNIQLILFTANATDEQILDLFEIVYRRYSVQR